VKKIILIILTMISWNMAIYASDDRYSDWIGEYILYNRYLYEYALMLHKDPKRSGESRENILHHIATWDGRPSWRCNPKDIEKYIKYYVKHGAKINGEDDNLNTPLHLAVSRLITSRSSAYHTHFQSVVTALLKYGANPKLLIRGADIFLKNDYWPTSPDEIRKKTCCREAFVLFKDTFDAMHEYPGYYGDNEGPLRKTWVTGCLLQQQEASYPPWVAISRNKRLRRMFNDPTRVKKGYGILHSVASINDGDAHLVRKEDITTLVKMGADINAQSTYTLETPLHIAVEYNCMQMVCMLLKNGADPLRKNRDGKTPLDLLKPSQREVRVLLEKAAAKPSTFLQDLLKSTIMTKRVIPERPLDCLRSKLSKSPAS
jgi:hypothetical protein